jgi:hypothetical protein
MPSGLDPGIESLLMGCLEEMREENPEIAGIVLLATDGKRAFFASNVRIPLMLQVFKGFIRQEGKKTDDDGV